MKLIIKDLDKQNKEVQNEIMDYLSGLSLKWYIVISKECDACNNKCYRLHKIDTKEQGFIRVCQTCFIKIKKENG